MTNKELACTFGLLLGIVLPCAAGEPLFVWMEPSGALHATDRLQAVPEPWFSAYKARLEELKKRGEQPEAADDTQPSPSPPPRFPASKTVTAEEVAAQRQAWRDLVKHYRRELGAATDALKQLDDEIEATHANPILRFTPAVQEKLAGLQSSRPLVQARVEAAQRMLIEELPRRARVEHVPLLWLM